MNDLVDRLFDVAENGKVKNSIEAESMMMSVDDLGSIASEMGAAVTTTTSRSQILENKKRSKCMILSRMCGKNNELLMNINFGYHALLAIIQLLLLSMSEIVNLWAISYLFINFIVISAVLLVNYFPYQVLIDNDGDSSVGISLLKSVSYIRQTVICILLFIG